MRRPSGIIAIALLLASCVAAMNFNPQGGTTFEEFKHNAGAAGKGFPELVGLKGNTSVYRLTGLTDHNTFYWFENGRLSQVTQGELPQVRLQIETINR